MDNLIKARFESSILSLVLYPDSRDFVQFTVQIKEGSQLRPLSSTNLTCEYLTDLLDVTVKAMQWIMANCEEISNENLHLYYKFKGDPSAKSSTS